MALFGDTPLVVEDLPTDQSIVLAPPTVEGLAATAVLTAALDEPSPVLVDPLDLPAALRALANGAQRWPQLTVAGIPLTETGLAEAVGSLTELSTRTPIEWYDNHVWPPDAQTAIWPVCRRAEIGPDVPPPVHLLAATFIDGTELGRRLTELVERGTDATDPWVKRIYRLLAGLLPEERANLRGEVLSALVANSDQLVEVEDEIVAEQTAAEKTIERLVREELRVAQTSRRTPFVLAADPDWSASPYLLLATRRFFNFQVLVRLLESGRVIAEAVAPGQIDFTNLARSADLAGAARSVRATRRRLEIDPQPGSVRDVVQALVDTI